MGCRRRWLAVAVLLAAPAFADPELPPQEHSRIQAFLDAAQRGDVEAVRQGLAAGMPVDVTLPPRDPGHPYTVRTPLEAASLHARLDVVRLLLARGATLRRDARYGVYPASLHTVESPELLALLVAHAGPDAALDADFGPALVRAAANGAAREVDSLLSLGVDPDFRSPLPPWNEPAIVRADGHLEIVDRLLEAGADPRGGDPALRWSALFPAARAGDAERVRRYLALGVDPHLEGERGNALSVAACSTPRSVRPTPEAMARTTAVASLLLGAGVDPNARYAGRTPLRCAEDNGNAALAAALEAAGGRSRESLWNVVLRSANRAALGLALLLGGGM